MHRMGSSNRNYYHTSNTHHGLYSPRYKTTDLLNDFVFNPGDLLLYTAYADSGERKISDKPLADRSYTFQYSGIPCHEEPFVTDSDGNVYNTVIIGNQCWMKENLKTTTYNDGTPIPNVEDSSWVNITHGVYCWYDNNFYWSYPYGALYNWYTVEDTTRICPEGWHVPTLNEFQVLKAQSSGLYSHGISLKSCRQVNYFNGLCNTSEHPRWEEHNENHGVDEFGFSGLPGGIRFIDGAFLQLGTYGYWWTCSDSYTGDNRFFWYLIFHHSAVQSWQYDIHNGFSVRCMKNINSTQ